MKSSNHIFIIISIITLSLISCKTSDKDAQKACGTSNPLQDLPWLNKIKTEMQMSERAAGGQIIGYSYKGNDVFWIDRCYHCTDDLISVYNCQGEVICEFGGIAGLNTCPDFHAEATDSTMLFDNVQH